MNQVSLVQAEDHFSRRILVTVVTATAGVRIRHSQQKISEDETSPSRRVDTGGTGFAPHARRRPRILILEVINRLLE